jgi:Flp pilus assembly pilin Flp
MVRASGTWGRSVRRRQRDERGGSAIEAALLIAAVSLVLLPVLFLLGRAVDSAFGKPCEQLPGNACASRTDGGGGGGGSGGGGADDVSDSSTYTADLESRVANEVSDRVGQAGSATCEEQDSPTPPRGATATCTVQFADGSTAEYVVEWTDDAGSFDVRPV